MTEKPFASPYRFRVLPWAPLVGNVDPSARIAAIRPSLTTKGMYLADLVARLEDRFELVLEP